MNYLHKTNYSEIGPPQETGDIVKLHFRYFPTIRLHQSNAGEASRYDCQEYYISKKENSTCPISCRTIL